MNYRTGNHEASGARPTVMMAVVLAAWLRFVVHNMTELGARALLWPDTLVPTAVYLLLVIVWLSPARPLPHVNRRRHSRRRHPGLGRRCRGGRSDRPARMGPHG